jgi:lipoprotein-anchoring transpeptidase ErfK/SrfK
LRVSGHRIFIADIATERFWQIAVLTAAGVIGATSQADAALYYWQDSDPGYSQPAPAVHPRRQRARRHSNRKPEVVEKETGAKPQGPLIIAISIDKQKVRIYDANGFFAESPVSTGMKGHSTPMGVFSVIQKDKFHHSNIYSGAPMPYMQRITWSGVAMHAGVLPGYPASHGCIRMPMAFAVKMWNWTRMGARVIVTPGEITPANFSHPLLMAQKVMPQPAVAEEPKADAPAVKTDKGADAGATIKSENSEANLELRSTVGHASLPATPLRAQTHTADASGAMPASHLPITMSDAPAGRPEAKPEAPQSEPVKSEAEAAPAKNAETVSSDGKPAEAQASSSEAKSSEAATAEEEQTGATDKNGKKVDEAQAPAGDAAKAGVSSSETAKTEDTPAEAKVEAKSVEAKPDDVKTEAAKVESPKVDAPKVDEPKAAEKPVKAVAVAPTAAPIDVKKDTARLPGAAAAAKPQPPKRTGQIAVFVSRKDSKLYVRQEFKPLFEVPVTIAPSDRPLGTHVFTAETDKSDPNQLRWSVVTLPMTARNAARIEDEDRPARRRKTAAAPVEMKPAPVPDSPAEALDRITVPPDAMTRIAEALTTGASIVVSDLGVNQGETGEGTDFIVPLR